MKRRSRKIKRRPVKRSNASIVSREEFYLNKHDEEKVLLFLTGLVFGMGVVATILDEFVYGGLAMLVVGLALLLIGVNVEEKTYKG